LHQDGKREKSRGEMDTREQTSISSQDLYADAEECDEAIEDLENVRKRVQNWKRLPPGHVPLTIRVKNFVTTIVNGVNIVISFTVSIPGRVYRFSQLPKEERKATYAGWSAAIKSEAKHYWLGTKLLWKDVKIASRILSRVLAGKTLSRRERQQLTRTTADIFRVVPMMVFLVIPFMELLLPVALKLFPNMLPSTFEDKLKKEEEMKRRIGARLEIAKFLQDTVAEMAGDITAHRSGDTRTSAAELYSFMQRVRAGENVNTSELLKFAKLFNDELTLDNLERVQLVSLCRFVGISPFGTDAFLRTRLRSHLLEIKADDRDIQEEGIESLTEDELRQACRARGMRAPFGEGAVKFMRQQLAEWLDWSLNRSLPSSLLLLSRAFTVTTPIGQPSSVDVSSIRETLSTMPEEVVEDVELFATSDGGDKNEAYERKLELLEREEELIREEQECEVEFDFPTIATTGTVAEKTATAAAAAVVKEAAASSLADVLDRESEEEKSVKAAAAKQAKMQKILKYAYC
jgi:LETM1 and EF-hand domain-containing protein 1